MGVCVSKASTFTAHQPDETITSLALVSAVARNNREAVTETEIKCRKVMPKLQCKSSAFKVTSLIAEWKINNVLSLIQSHVLAVSSTQNGSVEELSLALTQFSHLAQFIEHFEVQAAKAYAIFYWITINVKYDKASWIESISGTPQVPSIRPVDILTKRETVSEGFATLFQVLASHAGLNAKIIRGHERAGRILGKDLSTSRFVLNEENAHAWNSVEISDAWVLLDCSYGPRSVAHGWQTDCSLSQYYFAVPPEHMIFTHWPQDQRWQLLERTVDLSEVELLVAPHAGVFALGITAVTCCEEVELKGDLPGPVVHVELEVPSSLHLSACLAGSVWATCTSLDATRQCGEDRTTYIHREGEKGEKVHIYVLCPAEGKFCLQIFARPLLSDPQMFCFSYYVVNHVPGNEYCNCPVIYHMAAAAFKFQLLSWNTPQMPFIAKNESGKMDITFNAAQNVKFHHYIVPKGHANDPSQALYYYTHLARHKTDTQCCLMQVLFPTQGWWNVFIWCCLDSTPNGSTSGYTLVANIQMYACIGIKGQTFPRITSPSVTFDDASPMTVRDGEVLEVPFGYSDGDTLEAYITRDSTKAAHPMADYATVEDLKSGRYLLRAVLPQPGKWEICVIANKASDTSPTEVMVFQLFADIERGLKNTVFPYLFTAPAADMGVRLVDSKPVTYPSDGGIFTFSFEAPDGVEFQHGIQLAPDPYVPSNTSSSLLDYYTYLQFPSNVCNVHTIHSIFPSPGVWSVIIYARKGSSGVFHQVICLSNLEISTTTQTALCYPKLNPSFRGILIASNCLPCPSVIEQPEFRFPFSAPGSLYFSCSMNMKSSEEYTLDHAFVHNTEDGKYLLHVVFPKPGVWLIYVNTVRGSMGKEESKLLFQLKLKAVAYSPDVAFPQVFEPFYTSFKMSIKDAQLPLLRRVKKLPSTLVIPFYCPSDVLLWHLAQVNEAIHEAATQIPPSMEPGKHELVVDFNKSGKWVITLYAQHSSAENKADWTPILRHTVSVGRTLSTQSNEVLR